MTSESLTRGNEVLSGLDGSDHAVQQLRQVVGNFTQAGNISGSTGVAIGNDIRVIINQFPGLTVEQVAQLLETPERADGARRREVPVARHLS